MKNSIITLVLTLTFFCCQSQKKNSNAPVGGPCEGCEAVFEYGKRALKAIDTLPGFHQNEPKLKITGTVFKKDGREPAENVILYIY
ncbi:MAG: intradiol ring-cleavage dioxygenase, partial [Flavobacteriaceae bacterium]|nr:intradiol ring-cleavage dioxygenase [Flavobacteriaceae bacterium]